MKMEEKIEMEGNKHNRFNIWFQNLLAWTALLCVNIELRLMFDNLTQDFSTFVIWSSLSTWFFLIWADLSCLKARDFERAKLSSTVLKCQWWKRKIWKFIQKIQFDTFEVSSCHYFLLSFPVFRVSISRKAFFCSFSFHLCLQFHPTKYIDK